MGGNVSQLSLGDWTIFCCNAKPNNFTRLPKLITQYFIIMLPFNRVNLWLRQPKHELPRGSKARSVNKLSNPLREVRQGCHKSESHPVSVNLNNIGIRVDTLNTLWTWTKDEIILNWLTKWQTNYQLAK